MIALALGWAGCSKKSSSKPASQIASISNSNGATWNFSYDGQGRVETILYSFGTASFTKTFKYANNEVMTSTLDQTGNLTLDTLDLNADGSISIDRSVEGNAVSIAKYSYFNGDLDTSSYTTVTNGVQNGDISTYTFDNGDLVSTSFGVTYTYYQNQPATAVDQIQAGAYETYGNAAYTFKCLHMAQSYTSMYGTINFTYTYDSLGRVTQIAYENSTLQSTTISWQ